MTRERALSISDVREIFENIAPAGMLLRIATQDYAASRCLLLNWLPGGFVLGAQSIEKYLKSYIIISEPGITSKDLKKISHNLSRLLADTDVRFPHLQINNFSALADKFSRHYDTRYPDNPNASKGMTTADMFELDEFIIFLNENLPIPRNARYRTSFYHEVTFSLMSEGNVTPCERWIKQDNHSFAPIWPRIRDDYAAVMEELYPKS